MGTTNKQVNRIKSWITNVKNRIITQDIVPPKIDAEKFQGSQLGKDLKNSPWWIILYSSKTRPKLTRLQPLKTFGTFSPYRKFNFVKGSATPKTRYAPQNIPFEPEKVPE